MAGSKTYTYDNAGNLTSVTNGGVTTTVSWDGAGRLTSVSGGGLGTTNTSTYNGLDQRVEKVDSTGSYYFTLADDHIDANVLADSAATYQHGFGLLSETRSSTTKFFHADSLGTARVLTNTSGTTTDALETDAFGMVGSTSGTPLGARPFGFAASHGYQADSDTGLQLLGYRFYDPSTGRFLSRDLIQDGYNWYVYCDNDPVNAIDPEGLGPGDPYPSMDAAGKAAIIYINDRSIKNNKEYTGWIIEKPDGSFTYTDPDDKRLKGWHDGAEGLPKPPNAVAHYHTHGAYDPNYENEDFSIQDKRVLYWNHVRGYLGTPDGKIMVWIPQGLVNPSAPVLNGKQTPIGRVPKPKPQPKPKPKSKPKRRS